MIRSTSLAHLVARVADGSLDVDDALARLDALDDGVDPPVVSCSWDDHARARRPGATRSPLALPAGRTGDTLLDLDVDAARDVLARRGL